MSVSAPATVVQAAIGGMPPCRTVTRHQAFDTLGEPLPPPRVPAGDARPDGSTEAALIYTSGTTGQPKGCVMSNEYFHTFGGWYLSRGGRLAMEEGAERLYNPLPLS